MNKFDSKFKKIIDGLDIDDKPGPGHKDELRWQVIAEFNKACAHDRPNQGVFSRIGRFIMERKFASMTAAAVIIVVIIIGVTVFGESPQRKDFVNNENGTNKQIVKDKNGKFVAEHVVDKEIAFKSLTLKKKAAEIKHVNQLYAAKDVDGLIEVLRTGSSGGKLTAATYLADMGAEKALKDIKKLSDSWNGKENNPYPAQNNPFAPLVQKIEASKSNTNKSTAKNSREDKGPKEDGKKGTGGIVSAVVDKDNRRDDAFGLKVIDKDTGKPLADVEIVVLSQGGKKMKTNKVGRCLIEFGDKKPSHLTVDINAENYVSHRVYYNPSQTGKKIPKNHVSALEKGIEIGGIVRTVDGEPVKNASVEVIRYINDIGIVDRLVVKNKTSKTDKDGRWICGNIPNDDKEIHLQVKHPELASVDKYPVRGDIDKLRNKTQVLLMREGINVVGSVFDGHGNPIPGAKVFQGFSRHGNDPKTKTDDQGRFIFENCSPGEMVLAVKAEGFAQDLKEIQVTDKPAKLNFVLNKGKTLIVRVVDVDENPIKDVKIEADQWRQRRFGQRYSNLRIKETTDSDGLAVIPNAPDEKVWYNVYKSGFAVINKLPLSPSDKEQKIVLYPMGKLVGGIYDAQTGEPVKNFRMITGIQWYRENDKQWKNNDPTWQGHGGRVFTNGRYEQPLNHQTDGFAVKITADGYLPGESLVFYNEGKTVEHDIYLSKGQGPGGFVFDTEGNPVSGAKVTVATEEQNIYIQSGNTVMRDNVNIRCETDKDGKFELPAFRGGYKLLVMHNSGVATVKKTEFEKKNTILLEKWGRVEGVLYIGAQLAAGKRVNLQNKYNKNPRDGNGRIYYSMETKTNDKGEFVFSRVIPGERIVSKIAELSNRSYTYSHETPIEVIPGKTAKVQIGGGGRTVSGKIILPAGIDPRGLRPGGISLDSKPQNPEPIELPDVEIPEDIFVMSFVQREAWVTNLMLSKKGMAILRQFQKLQGQTHGANSYRLKIENDGAFVAEDVLPGIYKLTGRIHDPSLEGTEQYYRSTLGSVEQEVTIEEVKDSSDLNKPVNLGNVTVKLAKKFQVGDPAPEFELEKFGGKKIGLSNFRGKYLLLEKSMGNRADFNTKVLPELLDLYARFGGENFEILSVFCTLSPKPEIINKPLSYFMAYFDINWTVALDEVDYLGQNPKIMEDYGTGISVMHLVGPDGKVLAVESDITRLKEIIENLLTEEE